MPTTHKARSWRRKLLRGPVIYAVVPYVTVTIIFTLAQRRLMYRPTVADTLLASELNLDTKHILDVHLNTTDGDLLKGWLLKKQVTSASARGLVIYFPGNSMNRLERLSDLREVASYGRDVLIFDYRGFGDSSGSPTEFRICNDAKLIWQYATNELKYGESNIVVFGESLGGAVALSLWSDGGAPDNNATWPHPKALILSSTFASMPRTVRGNYPWFPFHYLVLDRWPSIDCISHVSCPITVLHGAEDEMVPVSEARALSAASVHATFVEIPGAGHNDVPSQAFKKLLEI